MITDIEDYFAVGCGRCDRFATPACSTQLWAAGLAELRNLCRAAGLVEVVKWGHPCYMHNNRNVAIIGAFVGDFRLTFFQAGLLTDSAGVLERSGPNTRFADAIIFSATEQVPEKATAISAYLEQAKDNADAGLRDPPDDRPFPEPAELEAALMEDPTLAQAWEQLTPGRRKGYVIYFSSAKQSGTRTNRIAKYRDKIISGKGVHDR